MTIRRRWTCLESVHHFRWIVPLQGPWKGVSQCAVFCGLPDPIADLCSSGPLVSDGDRPNGQPSPSSNLSSDAPLNFLPLAYPPLPPSSLDCPLSRVLDGRKYLLSFRDCCLVANPCASGLSASDGQPNRQSFPSLSNSRDSPSNLPRAIPPLPGLAPISLGRPLAHVLDSRKLIHRYSELGNFADSRTSGPSVSRDSVSISDIFSRLTPIRLPPFQLPPRSGALARLMGSDQALATDSPGFEYPSSRHSHPSGHREPTAPMDVDSQPVKRSTRGEEDDSQALQDSQGLPRNGRAANYRYRGHSRPLDIPKLDYGLPKDFGESLCIRLRVWMVADFADPFYPHTHSPYHGMQPSRSGQATVRV
jgi:hypothetical protein